MADNKLSKLFCEVDLNIWLIVALMCSHISYLCLFYIINIKEMFYFNMYSVINYAIAVFLYQQNFKRLVIFLTFSELILHQSLGMYFVGHQAAFTTVFMCVFLLQFTFFYKWSYRIVFSLFVLGCVYATYYYKDFFVGIYPEYQNVMFYFNIFIGAVFSMVYGTLASISYRGKISDLINLIYRDFLTGLYNRKYFEDKVLPDIGDNGPAVIAICDIDDFKKVNDNYGHDIGDLVLKVVSSAILYEVSEMKGTLVRWGGEEFLIKINVKSEEEAKDYLESIRVSVSNKRIRKYNISPKITIGGVFVKNPKKSYFKDYFKIADDELYYGKKNGKDCVNIKAHEQYQVVA